MTLNFASFLMNPAVKPHATARQSASEVTMAGTRRGNDQHCGGYSTRYCFEFLSMYELVKLKWLC